MFLQKIIHKIIYITQSIDNNVDIIFIEQQICDKYRILVLYHKKKKLKDK